METTMGGTDLSLVVLAAGVGSRYGGLKQLDGVGPSGETLMEYSIFDAARAGFNHVVFVVRPETEEEFRSTVGRRIGSRIQLDYVHQVVEDMPNGWTPPPDRVKPWGTGQAVLAAEPAVPGPFVVLNADDFYGAASFQNMGRFLTEVKSGDSPTYAIQGFEIGPTLSDAGSVSRGLCQIDGDHWLKTITEVLEVWKAGAGGRYTNHDGSEHTLNGDEPVSMNMWGFTPTIFACLRRGFEAFLTSHGGQLKTEFLLPAAIQDLIENGSARVKVLRGSGRWCGMTYSEDRARAAATIESLIDAGVYPRDLWNESGSGIQ